MERNNMRLCTIPELFNDSVIRFGNRRLQWFKTGPTETASLSYSDVGMIVRDMCGGLLSLGMVKGDHVAIMAHNCPEWLWADMAILNCGGVTVTIYPSFSAHEMKYIVQHSDSKMLFVRDTEGINKVMSCIDEMPAVEKVIVMEEKCPLPDHPAFIHISQLREIGKRYLHKNKFAYEKAWRAVEIWDPATIIYTSGTTGRPKGAVHSHQSIMYAVQADNNNFCENNFGITEDDVNLSFLPLSHSYERQCGQMQALCAGCTYAYAEKPQTIVMDMQIFRPTTFLSVPRIFERIFVTIRDIACATPESKAAFEKALDIGLRVIDYRADENGFVDMGFDIDIAEGLPADLKEEYLWADEAVFKKVRQLLGGNFRLSFSASAGLPAQLCKLFMAMGIRICEGYGLTETMNAVNLNNLRAILPGSIGPTQYFTEERLAEDGELLVRGGTVFTHYYKDPEATAEAFTEDGFFKTGDIAVMGPNGYYRIVDRKKSIMVLDTGKNVPRAKVEGRFATARYVEQVCAVGDDRKYVSAIIVPKYEAILARLQREGITFDENQIVYEGEGIERVCVQVGNDFINHPQVRKLVDEDVQEANAELEGYEQIKRYHISNRRFTENNDEFTPTMKIKYRNVIKNFSQEIEELYRD